MTLPKEFIIQHALRNRLNTGRADIFSPNANVYEWESDLLQVTKAGYVHEFEIKCSRADLINDVKTKQEKHKALKEGRFECRQHKWAKEKIESIKASGTGLQWIANHEKTLTKWPEFQPVPNYFWYVVVDIENFTLDELPPYAGVLTMKMPDINRINESKSIPYGQLEFLRTAPRIHKNKLPDEYMIKMLKSMHWRFWDIHTGKYYK